jgi:hypothetical protein
MQPHPAPAHPGDHRRPAPLAAHVAAIVLFFFAPDASGVAIDPDHFDQRLGGAEDAPHPPAGSDAVIPACRAFAQATPAKTDRPALIDPAAVAGAQFSDAADLTAADHARIGAVRCSQDETRAGEHLLGIGGAAERRSFLGAGAPVAGDVPAGIAADARRAGDAAPWPFAGDGLQRPASAFEAFVEIVTAGQCSIGRAGVAGLWSPARTEAQRSCSEDRSHVLPPGSEAPQEGTSRHPTLRPSDREGNSAFTALLRSVSDGRIYPTVAWAPEGGPPEGLAVALGSLPQQELVPPTAGVFVSREARHTPPSRIFGVSPGGYKAPRPEAGATPRGVAPRRGGWSVRRNFGIHGRASDRATGERPAAFNAPQHTPGPGRPKALLSDPPSEKPRGVRALATDPRAENPFIDWRCPSCDAWNCDPDAPPRCWNCGRPRSSPTADVPVSAPVAQQGIFTGRRTRRAGAESARRVSARPQSSTAGGCSTSTRPALLAELDPTDPLLCSYFEGRWGGHS